MKHTLVKFQILKVSKEGCDFQIVAKDENGKLTFAHAGNVPKDELQSSIQEILEAMDKGPIIRAPRPPKDWDKGIPF